MYINSIYNKFLVPPQQQVVTALLYNSVKDICITDLQFVPGSHVVQFTDPRIGAEEPSGHGKHCVEALPVAYEPGLHSSQDADPFPLLYDPMQAVNNNTPQYYTVV